MIRNLYILSEGGWAIKSAEIFADLFYVLTITLVYGVFIYFRPDVYGIVTAEALLLFGIYYYYLIKVNENVFLLALIAQIVLYFLSLPIPFLNPILFPIVFIVSCSANVFLVKRFSYRVPLLIYLLLFSYLFDSIFTWFGLNLRSAAPSSFYFPILETVEANSLGPLFSLPWLVGANFEISTFRSSFEYLSTYILIGISWIAFRRMILIVFFVSWLIIFFILGSQSLSLPLPWIVSFSSLAFIIHFAPGRNFYGSFFATLLSFILLMPIAFLMAKFGLSPILILLIFFPIEAIMTRVFLGK